MLVKEEKRVLCSVGRGQPLCGVKPQQPLNDIPGIAVSDAQQRGEARAPLCTAQRLFAQHARLLRQPGEVSRWQADTLDNEAQLVELIASRKQRGPFNHLGNDASNGPHVEGRHAAVWDHEALWCLVPPRAGVVAEEWR